MEKKYYTEIFTIDKIIIYGYAVSTDVQEFDWSTKRIKVKNKVYINKFASVMSKQKLEELKEHLKDNTIVINNNTMEAGLCEARGMLNINSKSNLSKDEVISKLSYKSVLWKLDKRAILSKINDIFNNEKFNENVNNISDKIQEEIGFAISRNIEKLGNFEIYNVIQSDIFRNYVNNTSIMVEKINKFDEDVIVNITYWNRDEVKLNNIYNLKKNENKISIEVLDNVSRVRVIIWNQQNGKIIYFYDEYMMQSLHMTMNMVTSSETIKDEWSSKLKKSSSNLSKEIDSIENVSKYIQHKNNIGIDKDVIDKTKEESRKIQKSIIRKKEKGCFIDKSNDKESEIKCLKKIQGYLQESNVKKCIIVDPYFSIISASKLLTRIEKTNLQLEVIFSLYDEDPDTKKKNINILIDYKNFIQKNKLILHRNLKLINILSGKNQAFHDRYLIREFEDGHKDGFLLSNSINSMGQKYPFVIAPFEERVLKDVIEYVEKITTDKCYSMEMFYDYTEKHKNKSVNNKKYVNELEILDLYKKVSMNSGNTLDMFEKFLYKNEQEDLKKIIKDNIKEIIGFFVKECLNNNLDAFKSISLLMYISNETSDEIFNNYNLKTDSIMNYLVDILLKDNVNEENKKYIYLKQKLERLCDNKNNITAEEFNHIKRIFRNMISEYEVNNKYAMQLIRLLSKKEPTKLISLISKTKAPLVYVNLIEYLSFIWNEKMFKQLLQCNITSFKELGYSYAYRFIEKSNYKIDFINQALLICKEDKHELLAFILTKIDDENKSKHLKELKEYIIKELVNYMNENNINSQTINRLLLLLNCNDKEKSIINLFQLKKELFDSKIRKEISQYILSEIKNIYKDKYNYIYKLDIYNIILYIGACCSLELKNNILIADDLRDALIKENFMILGNPYLKDINYDKWNTMQYKFMINFIFKAYLLDNYNGENKRELINIMVNELNILMVGLCRIYNEYSSIILVQVIAIVAEWIRIDYIDENIRSRLYGVVPDWAKMIFLLNDKKINRKNIEVLMDKNIKFDAYRDNKIIISTIGEYIVLREKIDENSEIKEYLKKLRHEFINKYLNNEAYCEYLESLANNSELENIEWKTRGFGFEKLKNNGQDQN